MQFVLNADSLKRGMTLISESMSKHREYLTELDSVNGDGDLGVSMDNGYKAVAAFLAETQERDLGRLFMSCGKVINEASPSSLGTITSFGLMGMAKALKGKETADLADFASAMERGMHLIMEKAGSKPGEKTILDAICPAVQVLVEAETGADVTAVMRKAAAAAAEGSENTKNLRSIHGRAAYYGDGSIGQLDGGSVVGKILFETLAAAVV